jgi:CheY-like chemotaxis protein
MGLEQVSFTLHDIFTQCDNIHRLKAEEKGIDLFINSEDFVWRSLIGDPNKLTQILTNLLTNAIKFTDKGAVKLEAAIIAEYDNTVEIKFAVVDNGIGMTMEELDEVFSPFAQVEQSSSRKYGGTGLGLTIARDLVALMGGKLEATSDPGRGSSFCFTLAFDVADEVARTGEAAPALVDRPQFEGSVLVCEDNVINQQVIVEQLKRCGLTSEIATNGQAAVDLITDRLVEGNGFDLILMDIHMPLMDGIEATHKLLSLGITTPIIALTANAMRRDRENYLSLGMSDYISKPFYAQELWTILLKYLTPKETITEATKMNEETVSLEPESDAEGGAAINTKLGLEHAADDPELYQQLQRSFYTENQRRFGEFIKSMEDDMEGAIRIVHSLKSNAGWIGAVQLSQLAADTERTLKDFTLMWSFALQVLRHRGWPFLTSYFLVETEILQ